MPHLFNPYTDTVARSNLIAVVVLPLVATGFGYWISPSDRTLTLDQVVPFSDGHHFSGLALGSAYVPLGGDNFVASLVIAAIMIAVSVTFFMDPQNAKTLVRIVGAAGLLSTILMFILAFKDYLSRTY
jgi:hypothetical protein